MAIALALLAASLVAPGGVRAGVPGAPRNVHATAGNASATVHWDQPLSDGGYRIDVYWVLAGESGPQMCEGHAPGNSCTVTGLTNGTSYRFRVYACNHDGCSGLSEWSNQVTPAAPPGAPTNVHADAAANLSATITWTAPATTGGSPITRYTAVASGSGGQYCSTTGATSCVVHGLVVGTGYTFRVRAGNAVSWGSFSAESGLLLIVATVPGPPTGVVATAGNASASVSWTPPASNGGSAIKGYVVVASGGGGQNCHATTATHCTVTGLANGTAYTFQVRAENNVGWSAGSAWSSAVTPVAPAAHATPTPTATPITTPETTDTAAPTESPSTSPALSPAASMTESPAPAADPAGSTGSGGNETALLIALLVVAAVAVALGASFATVLVMQRRQGSGNPPPGSAG